MNGVRRVLRAGTARMAVVLLALCVGVARAEEPGEWEREAGPDLFFVSPVDRAGYPTHVVVRVVDDDTGEALPGATVALHTQVEYPVTGLVAADRTGRADADGWVRIRADDLGWEPTWTAGYWLYVEAAGHAGAAVCPGSGPDGIEIRLQRAQDVMVEVRDGLDRPVAGAVLGVRDASTCGHMNDQRIAVSGLDGVAVIPGLCAEAESGVNHGWECWVVADGIESTYHDLVVPGDGPHPQVLRHEPSRPVVGVILDAAGRPLEGAHVGGGASHRGPWALTDAAGRFRLVGARAEATVQVVQEYEGMYAEGRPPPPTFVPPPPGVPRILRMPPPGEPLPPELLLPVQITARDARSGEAVEDAPLVAWRDDDGWTARAKGAIDALPPGSFTVLAGGGLSTYAARRGRLEVQAETPARLVLDVTRHPPVRVVLEDDPDDVEIALVSADDTRVDGVAAEVEAGSVPVPPDIACAFRIRVTRDDHPHVEFVPIPQERGPDLPPLRLHATRRAVVRASLEGPDGAAVAGWLLRARGPLGALHDGDVPETAARPTPTVTVYEPGTVELLAVAEGTAYVPRRIRARVPPEARGGEVVDLGVVRLDARGDRSLRLLAGNGEPADAYDVRVIRDGVQRHLDPTEDDVLDPLLEQLAPGDVVIATAAWAGNNVLARAIRRTLEGPGPWTLQGDREGASIALDARDEDGNPLPDALLVIDGKAYPGTPDVAVDGLAAGPHRIAVAAPNRLTRLYRVVLKENEQRTITACLRVGPPDR